MVVGHFVVLVVVPVVVLVVVLVVVVPVVVLVVVPVVVLVVVPVVWLFVMLWGALLVTWCWGVWCPISLGYGCGSLCGSLWLPLCAGSFGAPPPCGMVVGHFVVLVVVPVVVLVVVPVVWLCVMLCDALLVSWCWGGWCPIALVYGCVSLCVSIKIDVGHLDL